VKVMIANVVRNQPNLFFIACFSRHDVLTYTEHQNLVVPGNAADHPMTIGYRWCAGS
jgi:hypothetical protein